jgi:hypothetical protein
MTSMKLDQAHACLGTMLAKHDRRWQDCGLTSSAAAGIGAILAATGKAILAGAGICRHGSAGSLIALAPICVSPAVAVLATFAASLSSLFGSEFMRRPLQVGCLASLAGNLALPGGVHTGKAATAPPPSAGRTDGLTVSGRAGRLQIGVGAALGRRLGRPCTLAGSWMLAGASWGVCAVRSASVIGVEVIMKVVHGSLLNKSGAFPQWLARNYTGAVQPIGAEKDEIEVALKSATDGWPGATQR